MPELPEVEILARGIKYLENRTLARIDIHDPKVWFESELDPLEFAGRPLTKVSRWGKYITYDFDGLYLVQHLRMTGKMLPANSEYLPKNPAKALQLRSTFHFGDETVVFYDTRRFGTLTAVRDLGKFFAAKQIAPDPLHNRDRAFAHYQQALKETVRPIKSALLDQSVVAGVGNIYADESLFRIKAHPLTRANRVKKVAELFEAHLDLFKLAIRHKGTTIINYRGADGESGSFAKRLKVYGRAGEKCVSCRAEIKSIVVSGRTTCFCPRCQKRSF